MNNNDDNEPKRLSNPELAAQIIDWYNSNSNNSSKWSNNPVGKAIKTIVTIEKHWKRLPGWDARAGGLARMEQLRRENGQ